ncbi:FAD-binding oxidoreductase [Streptomyces sp. NPDC058991]|uniref:FAD-binding oxidoreductase n=1 Tax=unclassified Streptomyces TaxID=2593676 RepID=UPI0036D0B6E5
MSGHQEVAVRPASTSAVPTEEVIAMEIDGFRGRLITARHADYDSARAVWNGAVDRRPRLIARCGGAADVVAAVRFARDHDLEIAVRGGGHNVAGTAVCDEGIVIDLSAMRSVRVDPAGRTARVQGGALWGDVDHEAQAHGLATTGGIVSHTGVAGLTLGGGIGFLMRKYGLTVDSLLAAEVVTADGGVVRASADDHPDLFWALRGGGGNFGVVTSFRFALHPVGPTVLAGPVFWAADDTGDVLRFYRDFAAEAPDGLGTVVRLGTVPPLPAIPEELHWRPAVAVVCCHAGAVEDGERAVRALRRFGRPLVDLVAPKPYTAHQSSTDDTVPHGWNYYWKATDLTGLSDHAVTVIADHAYAAGSPRSYSVLFHMGGAVARVAHDATAYAARDVAHNINIDAVWLPGESGERAAAETAWARRFLHALQPHRVGSVYVNFLDADDGTSRLREAYGERVYRRLADVKAAYDPDNAFHLNKNIRPGAASPAIAGPSIGSPGRGGS